MPAEDAASLFQVISRRYQKGPIILTTNRSVVSTISGDSYRLRAYQAQARKQRPKGGRN